MLRLGTYPSELGLITMASDGERLVGLWIEGQRHFASTLTAPAMPDPHLPLFEDTRRWLDRYFAGADPGALPPIRLVGTPFRVAVWEQLLRIPYGTVVSYRQVAEAVAARSGGTPSARATGGAIGHNPISIVVPCHRVVGSDGTLTGYAGGVAIKARLLALEGITTPTLSDPAPFL